MNFKKGNKNIPGTQEAYEWMEVKDEFILVQKIFEIHIFPSACNFCKRIKYPSNAYIQTF